MGTQLQYQPVLTIGTTPFLAAAIVVRNELRLRRARQRAQQWQQWRERLRAALPTFERYAATLQSLRTRSATLATA